MKSNIVIREKFRAPDSLHVLQYIRSFLCFLTLRPLGARLPILPLFYEVKLKLPESVGQQ
jgi:hypothetical protein